MYNPLKPEHCAICDNILATIDDPIEVAKACIECGFPAEEILAALEQRKAQAQTIKRKFFPERA